MTPRVTLGVATYERDTYLEEAVASCLQQTYRDLEVLVVLDGGRNPAVARGARALRRPAPAVVRHDANRGIAEAYNTIVREARGELIAMLGDDDRCEPDRIARQVAVFDRHPDTGVVHGAATIIDGAGVERGTWPSRDRSPHELLRHLVREHNTLVDPRAWSTAASTRPSAATTRASASPRTSTSGCAPCAPSASATCRAPR